MKKNTGLLVMLAMWSVPAFAVPVATVGALDVKTIDANLADSNTNPDDVNSGDANELAWARAVSGNNSLLGEQLAGSAWADGNWESVTGGAPGSLAFNLGGSTLDVLYFSVKLGTGNTNLLSHTLFTNNASTGWAYILASDLGLSAQDERLGPGRISHISVYGTRRAVPEPMTLGLLGLGLAGIGFARRRKV